MRPASPLTLPSAPWVVVGRILGRFSPCPRPCAGASAKQPRPRVVIGRILLRSWPCPCPRAGLALGLAWPCPGLSWPCLASPAPCRETAPGGCNLQPPATGPCSLPCSTGPPPCVKQSRARVVVGSLLKITITKISFCHFHQLL